MRAIVAGAALIVMVGCSESEIPFDADEPQDEFWAALTSHCGNAYEGRLVSDDEADADMASAEMVMHVRTCDEERITVPFHIKRQDGEWNRSRTWVFTRTTDGLRLKHDHRHEDGKSDDVTMYGGDTADEGTARRQSFPVDQESIAMFERPEHDGALDASVTNVWSVEVDPAGQDEARFAYQLTRKQQLGAPEDRNFRAEFDLTEPIDTPPAPWGF